MAQNPTNLQIASMEAVRNLQNYIIQKIPTLNQLINDVQAEINNLQQQQNQQQNENKIFDLLQNFQIEISKQITPTNAQTIAQNITTYASQINNLLHKKMLNKSGFTKNLTNNLNDNIKKYLPSVQTLASSAQKCPIKLCCNQATRNHIYSTSQPTSLFTHNSTVLNPVLKIKPKLGTDIPAINKYDKDLQGRPIQKFDLQDIIYTKLEDPNFMRSDPNTTIFWSKCDFILQNGDTNNIFWQQQDRKAQIIPSTSQRVVKEVSGDKTSDVVAHSLKRCTLKDVWRYNIDSGQIPLGQNNQEAFNELSKLFAERASGTVVFVSGNKDTNGKYGDTWENFEKPALKNNPDVTLIVEIDIRDPRKTKTITFPHGITPQIKAQYHIFKNLKDNVGEIDYASQPIKYKDLQGNNLDKPYMANPLQRSSSPPSTKNRPLQIVQNRNRPASPQPAKSNQVI